MFLIGIGIFSAKTNSASAVSSDSVEKTGAKSATAHQHNESGEADKPHTLAASLYHISENLKTTLTLNNKGPRPLEVRPTLYNLSGERLEIPPVTVEANSYSIIDLREWAALGSESFWEGSLQLFYRGNDLRLGAQVKMMDEAQSLMFDEQLVEQAMMFKSSRLEGVWWLPSQECQVEMCFSNTTDLPLPIMALAQDTETKQKFPITLILQPHETRITGLRDLLKAKQVLPISGSISITHQGQPGALLARGMVQESVKGFSSAIQFVDPATLKSTMLRGTGLHLEQIGGDELRPIVVAYNMGDATAVISGKVCFTSRDGLAAALPVAKVRLRAGELKLLSLKSALRRMKSEEITSAGLEFQYQGMPGSVMISALSVDASLNQVYQVPMLDPAAQKSSTGGYPWRIENSSSTMVYIMNTIDRLQYYTAYLKVAGGDYVMGTNKLEPGQTVTYDIRALRDNQVKDRDGRVIPVDATSGQFYWSIIQSESGPTQLCMIGRAEQIDQVQAMSSSYACQNCCNIRVADYGISPTLVKALPGDRISFSVWQDNYDCNGNIYPSNPPVVGWSSSNSTIAKMSGNVATAKNGGIVTITAQWNAYETSPPGNPDCGPPLGPQTPNLPAPCACSSNAVHISLSATLVVQVPTSLKVLSKGISTTRFPNPLANGCPPSMPYGMEIAVRYQVMDQMNPPSPIVASMLLRENVLNVKVDGHAAAPDQNDARVTATGTTEADGTFLDDGVGGCGTGPFGTSTFTQELIIITPNIVRYKVRTNLWALTGKYACGNMNNSFFGDIGVTVNCP